MTFRQATAGFLLFGAALGAGLARQALHPAAPGPEGSTGAAASVSVSPDSSGGRTDVLTGRFVRLELPGAAAGIDRAKLLETLDRRVERMAATLHLPPVAPPLVVHYYLDFESKARETGNVCDEHASDDGSTVHRVLGLPAPEGDGIAEAQLLLRRAWGDTPCSWLGVGTAVWLAGSWLGVPLADWPGRLQGMDQWLTARDLTARFEDFSYFFTWPEAGARVRSYVASHGFEALRDLYRGSRDDPGLAGFDPKELDRGAGAPAAAAAGGIPNRWEAPGVAGAGGSPSGAARARAFPEFLRGVCYAHHYSLENGYLAAEGGRHLEYLRDSVHVGAISVSPFGYIESATSLRIQHPYRVRGAGRDSDENDESLIEVTYHAHALGLRVLLAPHLWGRAWCGEWRAETADEWKTLFDEYGRFILHYAALAEYSGADIFQIGKELGATTGREAEWRDLIARIRRVYHGPIVYGANWDGEYARIAWWDAVDFIGVSEYAPLSAAESPGPGDLESGAAAVADSLDRVAARFRRPYLLTEVGFVGGSEAAHSPWLSFDRKAGRPDLDLQARCYDAVLREFPGHPSCAGMFWWKWFSDPAVNSSGRNRYDFPPFNKPAEKVLARRYGELVEAKSGG